MTTTICYAVKLTVRFYRKRSKLSIDGSTDCKIIAKGNTVTGQSPSTPESWNAVPQRKVKLNAYKVLSVDHQPTTDSLNAV